VIDADHYRRFLSASLSGEYHSELQHSIMQELQGLSPNLETRELLLVDKLVNICQKLQIKLCDDYINTKDGAHPSFTSLPNIEARAGSSVDGSIPRRFPGQLDTSYPPEESLPYVDESFDFNEFLIFENASYE
jgi:hypothetical protein